MFTGIVEEKGVVQSLEHKKNLMQLKVAADKIVAGTKIGDSVCVDGVCLTVTNMRGGTFSFDAMKETIDKTALKYLKPKSRVNLERSLKVSGRIGGHFVFGHVDGVGKIEKKVTLENYVRYDISLDKSLTPYIVAKGSIAIDGISLTVGEVKGKTFSVYIIPHTLKITTLGSKKKPDKVNIETDVLAKYILKAK